MVYQAVLFDLDGTLLDTLLDLGLAMNAVLRRYGFPEHELEEYRYFVGEGMENLVRRALPEPQRDETTVAQGLAAMRAEYDQRWQEHTRPYPGIPEMLDELSARGLKMAILSNKPDDFVKMCVARLLPHWRFESVLGMRPGRPRKPDPGGALEIAASLAMSPATFLYLGDTRIDMQTANAAGMFSVGALWGFRPAAELSAAGAKMLISQPGELLKLVER